MHTEPSFHASETIDSIVRMTAAKHTAEPGTPRTSAPVGAAAAAAAAVASGMSPPGSVASSALPPTTHLPSTPASGLTGGLSGPSTLTVFETALAGEEFYEREGYYPSSPGRTVARTGSFRRAQSRSSRQQSPAGVRNSSEHRYSASGPDSGGTSIPADRPRGASDHALPSKARPDGSTAPVSPPPHQPPTTYAQALMLPSPHYDVDVIEAKEAAVIMHAGVQTTVSAPPVAEAQPEESAALSRPDTESSVDEEGGPEMPAQAGVETDAEASVPAISPEMSFLSRAPEESEDLPPTHASFILPSRFSRDLSRSSESRLRARLVTAEEQVDFSPDTAALQPPMAGGSLPRIGDRRGVAGATASAMVVDGDITDWARSQSTSDQPWESEALGSLSAMEGSAQRPWPGAAHASGELAKAAAAKPGSMLSVEERHFSWCGRVCACLWLMPLHPEQPPC